ncbi:pyridoxal-phosphate dependent enzyme [Streptomyces wuyuanensis]|uniref:pyridoxal-phosphate dependent enzyme n=1 Tax=Streptomyces wuyuanensis TaxID=1196353 RepID=UPI0034386C66
MRLGLKVVLVFPGTADSAAGGSGNLVLDGLFGADIFWSGETDPSAMGAVAEDVCERLRERGAHPYLIPFGGSSALGARGYVEGGDEVRLQMPDVDHVMVALGSGGIMAGLVASLAEERVLDVHCGAVAHPAEVIATLATEVTGRGVTAESLGIRRDQVGPAYGALYE